MPVFGGSGAVDFVRKTVVRMQEDECLCLFEGGPDGVEDGIIKAGAEGGGAQDDAFDMGQLLKTGSFRCYHLG